MVGRVRSAAYGFTVQPERRAREASGSLERGASVEVDVLGRLVSAELADDVLYDPKNRRIRA